MSDHAETSAPVISSRLLFLFYKHFALPLLWFLLIVVFVIFGSVVHDERGYWVMAVMLLLMVAVSFLYLWRFPRILKAFVDEVRDAGDVLIVYKSGKQTRIPLISIANMETRFLGRGNIYYLITLRAPYLLGNEVAFFPINNGARVLDGTPWQPKQESIYDDLLKRIRAVGEPS
jgi:hypothetical protein